MDMVLATPQQLKAILQNGGKRKGQNQTELAAELGLSQFQMSTLEANPEKARFDRLFGVLSALGLEIVVRPRPEQSELSW